MRNVARMSGPPRRNRAIKSRRGIVVPGGRTHSYSRIAHAHTRSLTADAIPARLTGRYR